MRRPAPLFLLLLVSLFGAWPSSAANRPSDFTQALRLLERWSEMGPQNEPDKLVEAARAVMQLDRSWTPGHSKAERIGHTLLDFLGRCILVGQSPEALIAGPLSGSPTEIGEPELRVLARDVLRRRLPQWRSALTMGVLLGKDNGKSHRLSRRIAACEVLQIDQSSETTLALLSCTRQSFGSIGATCHYLCRARRPW